MRSRSIVIDVTRNIVTNGKRPSSGGPTCWNTGAAAEELLQQRLEQARHAEDERERARVTTELRKHARQ